MYMDRIWLFLVEILFFSFFNYFLIEVFVSVYFIFCACARVYTVRQCVRDFRSVEFKDKDRMISEIYASRAERRV